MNIVEFDREISKLARQRPIYRMMQAMAGSGARLRRGVARLCVLPLDQLRGLPVITVSDDDKTGVYFLWLGPRLLYVGQSVEIALRVNRHLKDKRFTHATWLVVAPECLRRYEAGYVWRYGPPYNRTIRG